MKTNDIKKGTRCRLRNGWYATPISNTKGNTRDMTVEGFVTETGSVYSHDIMAAYVDGKWEPIEHTPAQLKLREQCIAMGLG